MAATTDPATDGLSPEDINYFGTARRRLNLSSTQGLAQNAFQRGNAQINQAADLDALNNRYNQLREQLPGSYANRGLLNSGIYQQGLQNYATGRQTAADQLNRQYSQQLGGLTLSDQQIGEQQNSGLADIESQQTARRQAVAAALRSAL